jgi:hypothetical protein
MALDVEHHEMTEVSLSILALTAKVVGVWVDGLIEAVLEDAAEVEVLVAVEAELAEVEGGAVGWVLEAQGGFVIELHPDAWLWVTPIRGMI